MFFHLAKRGDLVIIPADSNTDTYAIENNRGFNLGFHAGPQFMGGLGIAGYGRNPKTGIFENWAGGGNVWGGLPFGAGLGINFGRPEVIDLSKSNGNNNVDVGQQQQQQQSQ